MFGGPFDESIIKRAKEKGLVEINLHNLRDHALDAYGTVDDKPYGGGTGMILRPEPIVSTLRQSVGVDPRVDPKGKLKEDGHTGPPLHKSKIILLSASGKLFTQQKAQELSKLDHLIFICGHYEGVDQRIADHYCDEELSIGNYVLTGGEIPAMVIVDSVVRLIPGVLSKEDATKYESFSTEALGNLEGGRLNPPAGGESHDSSQVEEKRSVNLLEHPQYTRPEEFEGHKVPEILLSGNHAAVAKWREEEAVKRTKQNRPDI